MANEKKMTMGVIVGNRGFFPDHLAKSGAKRFSPCWPEPASTPWRSVRRKASTAPLKRTRKRNVAPALFQKHAKEIDGVIVTLPNFGDERAIADTLRLARLGVPVLVQATPDSASKMTIAHRRDSFCGKMSACNNLKQYRIPYSLTTLHTVALDSPEFSKDLERFSAVCRVARGLRDLRIGAIGARPTAFNTVRYSEKLLEASGISGRNAGSERSARPHQPHERQRRRRRPKAGGHQEVCQHQRRA
jgi:L-fucose isomerase-like protein